MKDERKEWDQKRKRTVRIYKIALAVVLLAALGIFWYVRYAPNKTVMDSAAYFGALIEEQGGNGTLAEDELAIVMQDHVDGRKALLTGGELYQDSGHSPMAST